MEPHLQHCPVTLKPAFLSGLLESSLHTGKKRPVIREQPVAPSPLLRKHIRNSLMSMPTDRFWVQFWRVPYFIIGGCILWCKRKEDFPVCISFVISHLHDGRVQRMSAPAESRVVSRLLGNVFPSPLGRGRHKPLEKRGLMFAGLGL